MITKKRATATIASTVAAAALTWFVMCSDNGTEPVSVNSGHIQKTATVVHHWKFNAVDDLQHRIGEPLSDRWIAWFNDPPAHMCYGPYTTSITPGSKVVNYQLFFMVQDPPFHYPDDKAVSIDIYDATNGLVVDGRRIYFREGVENYGDDYRTFTLNYDQIDGHEMEFRTYFHGTGQVSQKNVTVYDESRRFDAVKDLHHKIGRVDGKGWSASVHLDDPAHMCFGPYATDIAPGLNFVHFLLRIDDLTGRNDKVVTIDVYDATEGRILDRKGIYRQSFNTTTSYQQFTLLYNQIEGNWIEYRTFWHDKADINQTAVTVEWHCNPDTGCE